MQEQQKNTIRRGDEDIVNQILYKYLPYWPVFMIFIVLALGGAYAYSKWATPTYEAYASLLIKDEKKGADESKMLEELNIFKGKKIVENEIEVLQSHMLMRQVVMNLGLYAPVFEQRKSRNVSAFNYSPVSIRVKSPDSIISVKKVPFDYKASTHEVIINNKAYPTNQWVNSPWGEIIFQTNSRSQDSKILNVPYFFSLVDVNAAEAALLSDLKVTATSKLSTVVDLKIKDVVPERGVKVLNELIKVYLDAEISDRNILASNTTAFVEERLRYVVNQLDSVENAIQRYRTSAGVINISEQGKMYLDNVGQYDKKAQEIAVQLDVLDQLESFVSSKNAITGIVPSSLGVSDPVLNQLLDKLNQSQLEYERLRKNTAENSPTMISLHDQIEKLKPSIMENIRTQRNSLEASRNNLTVNSNRFSSMLSTIPQKERQLVEISRQQTIKNQIYSFLLQKREEAALSSVSAGVGDTRVIDRAYASVIPVSPNMMIVYLAGAVAGFALALLFIVAKENLNKKILFRDEITNHSSVPVIGELIQDSSKSYFVIGDGKKTVIAEQFRSLRNALVYGEDGAEVKKILVTSAVKGEGKAFIANNLAMSLTLTGKKTLLVDLDFDNGNLSRVFHLEDQTGMSDFLATSMAPSSIVYKTTYSDLLYVIPVGKMSDAGTELVVGGKLRDLVKKLETEFEYIVVCAGSLTGDANTQAISHACDKTIFVIRHAVTPKSSLNMLAQNNKLSDLENPAFVFNGVKGRGILGTGHFGFGFGYGYNIKH